MFLLQVLQDPRQKRFFTSRDIRDLFTLGDEYLPQRRGASTASGYAGSLLGQTETARIFGTLTTGVELPAPGRGARADSPTPSPPPESKDELPDNPGGSGVGSKATLQGYDDGHARGGGNEAQEGNHRGQPPRQPDVVEPPAVAVGSDGTASALANNGAGHATVDASMPAAAGSTRGDAGPAKPPSSTRQPTPAAASDDNAGFDMAYGSGRARRGRVVGAPAAEPGADQGAQLAAAAAARLTGGRKAEASEDHDSVGARASTAQHSADWLQVKTCVGDGTVGGAKTLQSLPILFYPSFLPPYSVTGSGSASGKILRLNTAFRQASLS